MSASKAVKESLAGKLGFLALLFAVCWGVCLILALSLGHEALGGLAAAGAFGAAVFPWCLGGAVALMSGRRGRAVALVLSVVAIGALWMAPRL
jgi:hypothetical protein